MKDGVKEIVGKTIKAVVVGANKEREPRSQVFLIFSDGTSFEFYGDAIFWAGGIDRTVLAGVRRYIEGVKGASVERLYPDGYQGT